MRLIAATALWVSVGFFVVGSAACGKDEAGIPPVVTRASADAAYGTNISAGDQPKPDGGAPLDGSTADGAPNTILVVPVDAGADAAPSDWGVSDNVKAGGDAGTADVMAVARPFYGHPYDYPAEILRPSDPQPTLDGAVAAFYDQWKLMFVRSGCGGFYVQADTDDAAVRPATRSELQGYGMMIAVIIAGHDSQARTVFDGLFRVARAYSSRHNGGLMAGQVLQNGAACAVAVDAASQTDGDLDIAFALLMADRQWGSAGAINYREEAQAMIAAIKASEMNATTQLPAVGDQSAGDPLYFTRTRSSDLVVDHFRAFGDATNDPFWPAAVDASYAAIAAIQEADGATGLLPSYLLATASAKVSPATGADGAPDEAAARIPWRLGTDFIVNGDARAKTALEKMNGPLRTRLTTAGSVEGGTIVGDPGNAGTAKMTTPPPFDASVGVSAMIDSANQSWVDAIWRRVSVGTPTTDPVVETLRLLSLIVMSGNWWSP